uniref:Transposase n=1 Tax=Panagrolaimus sp. ES5 TaxID=591445 RepID=A0AC34FUC1_9BILA
MKTYGAILNAMKVSKQAWFQTLCGNHVQKLLLNAEKFEMLPCLKDSKPVQHLIQAFKFLKEIQSFTEAKFLAPLQIIGLKNSIKTLKAHMQKNLGEVRVTPKFHLLLHHFEDFVDEFQTLGYFTEQGIESLHAEINKVFIQAGFAKNKNQWLLKHQWRRNLLRDISNPVKD